MRLAEIFKVLLFGIVEGITEWLPISSTGHMLLLQDFITLDVSLDFWDMFLVIIQLGAILAVVILFWKKIWPFSTTKSDIISHKLLNQHANSNKPTFSDARSYKNTSSPNKNSRFITPQKFHLQKNILQLWLKVFVAVLPAIIIGLPFDDIIEKLFYTPLMVALMLIVYGIIFILIEWHCREKQFAITDLSQLNYKTALMIGIFQVLALIPGTSRSGATIIGAMLLGATREVAAEFTFFLAIPVMAGASLLKLVKFGFAFSSIEIAILFTGMLSAFIVSLLAIRFLMRYVKNHNFKPFGYYRILLGVIILILKCR